MRHRRVVMAAALTTLALVVAACGSREESGSNATFTATAVTGIATPTVGGDPLDGGFPAKETPTKGGMLTMAMDEDIDCWSGLSYYGTAWSVFAFMARGLYGYPNTVVVPATDDLQPELAADMPAISADGLTYTVTLRDGLTFPDGSPVTAKDVKATFERMLDPAVQCATGGPPASGYYKGIVGMAEYTEARAGASGERESGISGIKVVSELTTSFTLTEADGSFPRALAMPWSFIVPASTPPTRSATPPPFVGPYSITRYEPGASVTIEREPSWEDNVAAGVPQADDENNIDGISLRIGVPSDIQYAQLKSGALDLSFDGSAPVGPQVAATAGDPRFADRLFSTPDAAIDYAVFRTDRAPFDDVRLRRAVNYAIDRGAVVRASGGQLSRSVWSQILSQNLLVDQPTSIYAQDVPRATALMAESGVTTPIGITLAHVSAAPGPQVAAAVKAALEAIGFTVRLRALPAATYYGFLADPASDFDVGIVGWGQDYGDAITFYGPLLLCGQGANYGRFCDEDFDARITEINQLPPGADRAAQYAQLSSDTARDLVPWATLSLRRNVSLISERLGNYVWGPAKQFYFAVYFLRDGT